VLHADLAGARFKDAGLPYQRGVLLLALLVVLVRKLSEWLSTDALQFHFLFPAAAESGPPSLAAEWELVRTLLPEPIANGLVFLQRLAPAEAGRRCAEWARRSMVHCLVAGADPTVLDVPGAVVNRLQVAGARPGMGDGDAAVAVVGGEDPLDSWGAALEQLLARWV
jgi:hypothetical protein